MKIKERRKYKKHKCRLIHEEKNLKMYVLDKDGDETTYILKDKYITSSPFEYDDLSKYMEECTEETKKRINSTELKR